MYERHSYSTGAFKLGGLNKPALPYDAPGYDLKLPTPSNFFSASWR